MTDQPETPTSAVAPPAIAPATAGPTATDPLADVTPARKVVKDVDALGDTDVTARPGRIAPEDCTKGPHRQPPERAELRVGTVCRECGAYLQRSGHDGKWYLGKKRPPRDRRPVLR